MKHNLLNQWWKREKNNEPIINNKLFTIDHKETISKETLQKISSFSLKILFYFVSNKPKGRISKQVFPENKASQIFRKTNISYPLIRTRTCAYQGVRNVRFLENLACFIFSKHPFWDSPFCLIIDDLSNWDSDYTNLTTNALLVIEIPINWFDLQIIWLINKWEKQWSFRFYLSGTKIKIVHNFSTHF